MKHPGMVLPLRRLYGLPSRLDNELWDPLSVRPIRSVTGCGFGSVVRGIAESSVLGVAKVPRHLGADVGRSGHHGCFRATRYPHCAEMSGKLGQRGRPGSREVCFRCQPVSERFWHLDRLGRLLAPYVG